MLKTKTTNWNRLTLKGLLFITLVFINMGLATAEETKTDAQKGREEYASFNVGKFLTVGTDSTDGKESSDAKTTGKQDQSYLKSKNPIASLILQIINFLTLTAASLSFLAVVIGGFMMMSSAGNSNQIDKGKDILKHAVIGLVITLSAYFIVAFVQNLLFETAG